MIVDGVFRFRQDASSPDGKDADFTSFQSQSWIEKI